MSTEINNNRYINTIKSNLFPIPKEKAKRKNAKDEINNNR